MNAAELLAKTIFQKTLTSKQFDAFCMFGGGMGRVLGREKHEGWDKKLANLINSNCNELQELRGTVSAV